MRFLAALFAASILTLIAPDVSARAMKDGIVIDASGQMRTGLLDAALQAFDDHADRISRPDVMVVVDYARHSSQQRLYLVDMKTGDVSAYHVAHGSGSDVDHDGWLDGYSNVTGSNASSRGSYVGAERYWGKHGESLRLDGLDSDNNHARDRAIVLHSQPRYVSAVFLSRYGKLGRSNGCLVVYKDVLDRVMSALEGGAFLYVDGVHAGAGRLATSP